MTDTNHPDGESPPGAGDTRRPDELIGQTIGKYEVTDRIGQGGMGVVYRADDTSLGRTVALKFLPPSFYADEDAERRFVQEARAASALDHPNIAVIHEVGRSDRGQMFIAMGYYSGQTLEQMIEDGPLPIDEAVDYAIQTARGLARAHEAQIIHRDIKPGNLIVTDRGLVKILDFGLAKMQDATMTRGGVSLGTVAYMSPEQARNESLDTRTDLWALGVVLYELLAGQRPFAGSYEAAILYAAAHESHEPVVSHRPDVPQDLSDALDRLLEKDPADRFGTADEVVEALERIRSGDSPPSSGFIDTAAPSDPKVVGAQDLPQTSRVRALVKTIPVPIAVATAVSALVVVVLIGWIALGRSGSPGPSVVAPEQHAQARTAHDEALEYFGTGQFSLAQARLERAIQFDPNYSAAWTSLAALQIRLRDYLRAVETGETAVRLDTANATAHYNLGFALQETGSPERAAEAYRAAIRADRNLIGAYSALGDVLIELDQPSEAMRILDEGVRLQPDSEIQFLLEKNLGKARLSLGDPNGALGHLDRSLVLNADWAETHRLAAEAYDALADPARRDSHLARYFELETDAVRIAETEQWVRTLDP